MVLRYSANLEQDAAAIEAAVRTVLADGHRTADIARGSASLNGAAQHLVSTTEMGKLVHQALAQSIDQRQSMHAV